MLLAAAAGLMFFGAAGFALVLLPDLHGDLLEIGVRPSVLGATVLHLYFAGMAMFAFALIVVWAAVRSSRGFPLLPLPLAAIAVIHLVFGVLAFSRSHNPHHLGPILSGGLIAAALAMPASNRPLRE
jgi:hypothetical protein